MRLVVLALVVLILPASAQAAGPPQHAAKSPEAIAAYWTKERMRSAIPRERAKPGGGGGGGGGAPSAWTSFAVTPVPYDVDHRMNGKVFMTEGGVNYVCSGTSVAASTGVSLVWTAGHCTNEGPGAYVTNFMFAPAYYDGTTPYGRWGSTSIATTPQFENQGNLTYDNGAARVAPPVAFAGQTLTQVVGSRAMAFNYGVVKNSTRFTSYGYPAAGKFSGQRMWACDSPVLYRDGSLSNVPMGIGCNMTGGSSGGGWITTDGKVGSVNSYGYNSLKNVMFGPYQGPEAQALYDSMD